MDVNWKIKSTHEYYTIFYLSETIKDIGQTVF